MHQDQNIHRTHFILLSISLITLLISLGGSAHFDPQISNENGPIEMAQNVVLLAASIMALIFARRSDASEGSFWLLSSAFFFVLLGREISWGAAFLPLIDPIAYPTFPSSKVLWYRPAITPMIITLFVISIGLLIRHRGWSVITRILRSKNLPIIEGIFFVICAFLTTAAEGKMGLSLPFSSDTNYNLEETAELAAYFLMVTAALRVRAVTTAKP